VRTVRRWEGKHGFPIRRLAKGPKSPVIAMSVEIDAWLQSQPLVSRNLDPIKAQLATVLSASEDMRLDPLQAEVKMLQREREVITIVSASDSSNELGW
jgi:hypothetical protein